MTASRSKTKIPAVVCLGEVLIDFLAEDVGPLDSVSSFLKFPGGAPANVAVGIARLGVSCGFIGKVGSDPFGKFLISVLKQNGVNTTRIVRTNKAPTALAFVSRSKKGDRDFLFYRDICADALLNKNELPLDWLQNARHLHVGGVSLTRNPSQKATLHATNVAHQNGVTISFDPNLRLDLWSNSLETCRTILRQILRYTDIFLPSQEELFVIMETNDLSKALHLAHQLGPTLICVKRGAKGSLISEVSKSGKYNTYSQPPFEVIVQDTTGAGDGFNAGLIAGLVNDFTVAQAVFQGTAVASMVITKMGAMTGLPTKSELAEFLRKKEKSGD